MLADGQRLGLESSERVGAAVGSRIHCENHALAAVGSCCVCSLATMDPYGIRLVRNRSERTVSSDLKGTRTSLTMNSREGRLLSEVPSVTGTLWGTKTYQKTRDVRDI